MLDGKDFIEFDIAPEIEKEFEYDNLLSVYHSSTFPSRVDFAIFNMDFSMRKGEVINLIAYLQNKVGSLSGGSNGN